MVTPVEIRMFRNVHNLDRKFAYRNDGNFRNGREVSDPFSMTNGVKLGCVLAPTLFYILYQQCSKRLLETWRTESTIAL